MKKSGTIRADGASVRAVLELIKAAGAIADAETRRTLTRLGEEAVTFVRDRPGDESWYDQTGNLRSSIGYGVFNSRLEGVEGSFPQVLDGSEGARAGQEYLERSARELASHGRQTLIVVAGMDYAAAVEARDNKDVLASAELMVRKKAPDYMQKTRKRITAQINRLMR